LCRTTFLVGGVKSTKKRSTENSIHQRRPARRGLCGGDQRNHRLVNERVGRNWHRESSRFRNKAEKAGREPHGGCELDIRVGDRGEGVGKRLGRKPGVLGLGGGILEREEITGNKTNSQGPDLKEADRALERVAIEGGAAGRSEGCWGGRLAGPCKERFLSRDRMGWGEKRLLRKISKELTIPKNGDHHGHIEVP